MHTFSRAAAVLLLAAAAPAAWAAPPADVADLFPPGTLAYAELHDPAAVGPQVAALVKGSSLEDSIPFIHKRRENPKNPADVQGKHELAVLGLLASPEVLAEFGKFRGVAAGLVGFTGAGEPEVALAVLTGDSAAAGIAARAFLTLDGSVRKVGSIGDVPVYQFRPPAINSGPNGRPQLVGGKPTEGPHELTFAYVPGLVAVGTSRTALTPVVERFQGKAKGSLRETAAFKEAATAHRKPGLFFFANVPEFCAKYDAAIRTRSGGIEPDAYGWFKLVANAKAMRYVAGCARVEERGLVVSVAGAFDPAQKSPLLDFLAGTGAPTTVQMLSHAPHPATVAVAVTFPEKDRPAAVIGFLDALAKANGGLGRLPSEAVKELEAKYKVSVSGDLLGKTRAATVILPVKQELPKGAVALPVLVLHCESPEVAAAWEAFLPKLACDLAGTEQPQPSSEAVNGLKVLTLPGTGLPWKAAVHYARKDAVIAVGLDRKLVAAAATGDQAGSVIGGDRAFALPGGMDRPVAVASVGLGGVIRALAERPKPEGPVVPVGPPRTGPVPVPGQGPDGNDPPENQKEDEKKAWEAFLGSFDALPPAAVIVRRADNQVWVELWQPKAGGGGLAPVVNAGVAWFDVYLNRFANPNGGRYGGPYPGGFEKD